MQTSMTRPEIRKMVREGGYTILAWALNALVNYGQYNLAAMIIVALCLAPRRTELENNGVLSVLRNFKLQRNTGNGLLMSAIYDYAESSGHYDKVGATLVATHWWEFSYFNAHYTDSRLGTDDSVMFFTSAYHPDARRLGQESYYQHELCDHAGSQREQYFSHFRLILDEGGYGIRVIGKQMGRWSRTVSKAGQLPNGYFEYRIPSHTVLHRISDNLDGRTLDDVMEPGVWYNYCFQLDTELDLVDREAGIKPALNG